MDEWAVLPKHRSESNGASRNVHARNATQRHATPQAHTVFPPRGPASSGLDHAAEQATFLGSGTLLHLHSADNDVARSLRTPKNHDGDDDDDEATQTITAEEKRERRLRCRTRHAWLPQSAEDPAAAAEDRRTDETDRRRRQAGQTD